MLTITPARSAAASDGFTWSPAAAPALAAYQRGDYAAAIDIVRVLQVDSRSPDVQRDAALVATLCLLQGGERSDWTDGRNRLAFLARQTPALEHEPECNLAYGAALTSLGETAEALDRIDRAVRAFEQPGQAGRLTAALAALGRAWAAHTEWEITPRRFNPPASLDPAAIEQFRRVRIADVRRRLAESPDSAAALDAVDLALAQHLLARDGGGDEAEAILARLSEQIERSSAALEAAMLLADRRHDAGRAREAAALYESALPWLRGVEQERVAARLAELKRPRIVLRAPAHASPGERPTIEFTAARVAHVRVEMRRIDLDAWLAGSPPRGDEARLPESGPLVFSTEADAPAGGEDGWSSIAAVAAAAPVGAYAVIARGRADDGREVSDKRLMLVSGLRALVIAGESSVLVHAYRTGGDGARAAAVSGAPDADVRFWMLRSFAPVHATLSDGAARFRLPGESQVMRDRRWVCLIRAGDEATVVRGELPAVARDGPPRALWFAAPTVVDYGESIRLSGMIEEWPKRFEEIGRYGLPRLVVLNALDDVLEERELPIDEGGAFSVEIKTDRSWIGPPRKLAIRQGERRWANVLPAAMVQAFDRTVREHPRQRPRESRSVDPASTQPAGPSASVLLDRGEHAVGVRGAASTQPSIVVVSNTDPLGSAFIAANRASPIEAPLHGALTGAVRTAEFDLLDSGPVLRTATDELIAPSFELGVTPAPAIGLPNSGVAVEVDAPQAPAGSVVIARLAWLRDFDPPGGDAPQDGAAAGARGALLAREACAWPDQLRDLLDAGIEAWGFASVLQAGRCTLVAPIPSDDLGAYGFTRLGLTVIVRTPDGEVAWRHSELGARERPRLDRDFPSLYSVGDRAAGWLGLWNPGDAPLTWRVEVIAPPGLRLDARGAGADAWRRTQDDGHAMTIELEPHGSERISFAVGAESATQGDLVVRFSVGSATGEIAVPIEIVTPALSSDAPGALRVERHARLWTPPPGETAGLPFDPNTWTVSDPDGAALKLGQVIEVIERVRTEGARPAMAWRQRVPALGELDWWSGREALGEMVSCLGGELHMRVTGMTPGEHLHRYYVLVTRPGRGVLPPPSITFLDAVLPVKLSPERTEWEAE